MGKSLDYSKVENQLTAIRNYIHQFFALDSTGHDFYHMKRVAKLARFIAEHEKADLFVTEVGAWLHDIGDDKLFSCPEEAIENMISFLKEIKIPEETISEILNAIEDISFRGGKTPKTIEGKIIQDADRLDAIGAIGIARTFAYGGAKGQLIYNDIQADDTSIQHFHDKLLLLKDRMNTEFAKKIAQERHEFMESFLSKFYDEW